MNTYNKRDRFLFIGFGFYIILSLLMGIFTIIGFVINLLLFLLLFKIENKFLDKWLYTAIAYTGSVITFLLINDIVANTISSSSIIIYLFLYLYCIIREKISKRQ